MRRTGRDLVSRQRNGHDQPERMQDAVAQLSMQPRECQIGGQNEQEVPADIKTD